MSRFTDLILRASAALAAAVFISMAAAPASAQAPAAPAKKAPAVAKFDAAPCLGCHTPIKDFHDQGKHKAWPARAATRASTSTSPTPRRGR